MAGLLDFNQYIGGDDNVQVEPIFPSTQKSVVYDFGQSIAGWNFHLDYETIVVDQMGYDRYNGDPNFANSKVIGYFTGTNISTSTNVNVIDEAKGVVKITFPANLYSGPVIPDARNHIPITVVGVTWTTSETPATIETHRWAFIQSWEPGVEPADPVLDAGYTPISVEV